MAKKTVKLEQGVLLLSEPFLMDSNFKRSVILLAEYTADGAIGFVLNESTNLKLNDIIEDFPKFDAYVSLGGPVNKETLNYVHRIGDKLEGSREVCDGVYWGGDFDRLKLLIETEQVSPADIRFFVGHAGWGTEQLNDELAKKTWLMTQSTHRFVFNDGAAKLWSTVLRSMGNEYAIIANAPAHPSLN